MAQQVKELLKGFSDMSEDEQLEFIRGVRNRKHTERPAVARRERKARQPAINKATKLLEGLSANDLEALLREMQDD